MTDSTSDTSATAIVVNATSVSMPPQVYHQRHQPQQSTHIPGMRLRDEHRAQHCSFTGSTGSSTATSLSTEPGFESASEPSDKSGSDSNTGDGAKDPNTRISPISNNSASNNEQQNLIVPKWGNSEVRILRRLPVPRASL